MTPKQILIKEHAAIPLGMQGDGNVREIVFPLPSELAGNTWTASHQRATDAEPYPVALRVEENRLIWLVSEADTYVAGQGRFQLICVDTNDHAQVLKTKVYQTYVVASLPAPGDVPDPVKPWYDELMRELADISDVSPEEIEQAVQDYLTEHPIEETDPTVGITGATVGQTVKVTAVDENGKPTAWEAAEWNDGLVFRHIRTVTIPEDPTTDESGVAFSTGSGSPAGRFFFDTDENGEPFSVRELIVSASMQETSGFGGMQLVLDTDATSPGYSWGRGIRTLITVKNDKTYTGSSRISIVEIGDDQYGAHVVADDNGTTKSALHTTGFGSSYPACKTDKITKLAGFINTAWNAFTAGSTFDFWGR